MSVIVPFYNAETYLDECLTSLIRQSLSDIEILLVDDGSTDRSPAIADQFAHTDNRVRVITQENSGPGGARNRGVDEARGRYLTFVDSDDKLPRNALQTLIVAAEKNQADVVVGAIRRFDESRSWLPEWSRTIHAAARLGIRLTELPELVRNNYPVGKVYRREFWLAQELPFEKHVIYEDQPHIALMLLRASRINVLPEIVYDYRRREDRSSISQRPEEFSDLSQRAAAWDRTLLALAREASPTILSAWFHTIYDTHVHWYLNNDAIEEPTYWHTLRDAVARVRQQETRDAWDRITAEKRTAIALLSEDLHDDFLSFRAQGGYDLDLHAHRVDATGIHYELPLDDHVRTLIPAEARTTPSAALVMRQRLLRGGWLEGARLRLDGFAYIHALDPAAHPSTITIEARSRDGEDVAQFLVVPSTDPALRPAQHRVEAAYQAVAYRAELDLSMLNPASKDWNFFITVTSGPVWVTEPLRNIAGNGGLRELGGRLHQGRRFRVVGHKNRHVGLSAVIDEPKVEAQSVTMNGRRLSLHGRSSSDVVAIEFTPPGSPAIEFPVQQQSAVSWTLTCEVPALLPASAHRSMATWTVRARTMTDQRLPVVWGEARREALPTGTGLLRAYGSAMGNLKLEEFPHGAVFVTELVAEESRLSLEASALVPAAHQLTELAAGSYRHPITASPDAAFTATFPTRAELPPGSSLLSLTATTTASDGSHQTIPVLLTTSTLSQVPLTSGDLTLSWERAQGRTLGMRLTDD